MQDKFECVFPSHTLCTGEVKGHLGYRGDTVHKKSTGVPVHKKEIYRDTCTLVIA